ncbi:MAG: DEAD/DEAH box helicase [Planctomycetes bacterium]|nr:DEAD/DEAH box helicase [Planctomycetota bacterium]
MTQQIQQNQPNLNFFGLGIAPKFLEILAKKKFTIPTPIQVKAIPAAIEGKDIVGIAQTGTGKTLAFAIPMLQRLMQQKGRGLIIAPTRELAIQIEEHYRIFVHSCGIRTAVLIGGASMYNQIQALRAGPRVIIATPGRLIDHIQQRNVHLGDVNILVLDEADRMLDMGFAPQINQILETVPRERQTMLFSATIPDEIVRIATSYMKLPIKVEIARSGTAAEGITQEVFIVKREDKRQLIGKLLEQYKGSVLLFSRTKIGASKITRALRTMGHRAAEIHSDRSLYQRREALEGFKSGRYRILVATDIAARGIDVSGIELVINYDLPDEAENYVHRIGRTGRAGQNGHAISFAEPEQGGEVRNIERLIRIPLPIRKHPELPAETFVRTDVRHQSSRSQKRGQRSYGHGGGYRHHRH